MDINLVQNANTLQVEKILTAAYGSPERVPKSYNGQSNVNLFMVGRVKPKKHFIVSGDREVKKGTTIMCYTDLGGDNQKKVLKQLRCVSVEELSLEIRTDDKAVMYIFTPKGSKEMLGYIRLYAGIITFCSLQVKELMANEGYDRPIDFIGAFEKSGKYKIVHITDHAYFKSK